MSDAQFADLYERLIKGKATSPSHERVFQRGWNAGIDFAIKQLSLACDVQAEEIEPER
jgi:hypothetical protein